jgi:hypothetical protein
VPWKTPFGNEAMILFSYQKKTFFSRFFILKMAQGCVTFFKEIFKAEEFFNPALLGLRKTSENDPPAKKFSWVPIGPFLPGVRRERRKTFSART